MNPGIHSLVSSDESGTDAHLLVRTARYLAAFAAIGANSRQAIARETGLDPKSVWTGLSGGKVGEQFIAKSIAALRRNEHRERLAQTGIDASLDSLFEVACADV